MSPLLRNTLRFIALMLVQVFLTKITLRWWTAPQDHVLFIPYIYPLFILLLPFETSVPLMLGLGFAAGISVDAMQNTAGMHAAATVLMAYLRTNVLSSLLPKNLAEYPAQSPGVRNMGWAPFLTYAAFLLVIHHFTFFIIEHWSFSNMGYTLLKVLASTVTSLLCVVVYLLLFTRQASRA